MAPQVSSLEVIQDFLAQRRIAFIGLSRDSASFSAYVFKELSQRGYELVPVNPNTPELHGWQCFARVQDIQPPVQGALLMTSPEVTNTVVRDCAEAGISRVWMHQGGGPGAVDPRAVEFCHEQGIRVIPGQCPLMFLPSGSAIHRFHGFIRKITGRYPKHTPVSLGQKAA